MGVKSDRWIAKMAQEHRMIDPFAEAQVREGVISYGVSSYGYDMRVAREFKIFTNAMSAIVDPKHFDPKSFVEFEGRWYLFYHDASLSGGVDHLRSVKVKEIAYDDAGRIRVLG